MYMFMHLLLGLGTDGIFVFVNSPAGYEKLSSWLEGAANGPHTRKEQVVAAMQEFADKRIEIEGKALDIGRLVPPKSNDSSSAPWSHAKLEVKGYAQGARRADGISDLGGRFFSCVTALALAVGLSWGIKIYTQSMTFRWVASRLADACFVVLRQLPFAPKRPATSTVVALRSDLHAHVHRADQVRLCC